MGTDQRTEDKWILSSILMGIAIIVFVTIFCLTAYNVGVYVEYLRTVERQKIADDIARAQYVQDCQDILIIPAHKLPIAVVPE